MSVEHLDDLDPGAAIDAETRRRRGSTVLEHVRGLYYDCHEGYALYRCRECTQIYLEQFHEIIDWFGGEDDLWQQSDPDH